MHQARLRRRTGRLFGVVSVAGMVVSAEACNEAQGPPRAQLLVFVDTDAHVVGELATRSDVSPDSAIDSLRIDLLDANDVPYEVHTLIVSDVASWPVSFGIQPPATAQGAGESDVRVRLRGFRGLFASSDTVNGEPTLAPMADVAIDRLVEVALPSSTEETIAITLAEDCLGVPATLGSHPATCVAAGRLSADPHEGVTVLGGTTPSPSVVGTWPPAIAVPCSGTPAAGEVCIPGGFAILGDPAGLGVVGIASSLETLPLRPVILSPFYLDRYELTVADLRALVQSGKFTEPLPVATSDPVMNDSRFCTWTSTGGNGDLAVNCIGYASARLACQLSGGSLPTEAQWEYAARGRGQRRAYPWGNALAKCCSANLASTLAPGESFPCPDTGVESGGLHPVATSCASSCEGPCDGESTDASPGTTESTGDVTRDGVFDMAGNVWEPVVDTVESYADACWTSSNILRDPSCTSGSVQEVRGSNWAGGLATPFLPLRWAWDGTPAINVGVRCAHAE